MIKIDFHVMRVSIESDGVRIESHTAWLGDIVLSKLQYQALGKPTVGDTIVLDLIKS